ncbi:lipocalin-like domain-containing protein [Falsiruegeria mediterranea]|jgi:predicted secreted hydrolase|uniref:AttH domain-containing protein n=1 Tax=Falsiruegeria mediterranea M17 TaxID=1200281 RepID=A0A2R8C8Z4_9RHOB|nr:lipocalin-like domain-containing protein [Falsiruegeria mediterranea]SPJ28882.1 hypothetical protein TRM7615_02391 [Falsiruegeria mediterranea M17]
MNVRMILLVLLMALPGVAGAQGFAGLGATADGFAVPKRGNLLNFPDDHGPHPSFRIEWWYVTANLTGTDGRDYGIQWTLFRSALRPFESDGWQSPQLWMGHAAVTSPEAHFFDERFARDGIGQAGVTAHPFEAWIDDWQMVGPDFDHLNLRASGSEFTYDLDLVATGPLVAHGDRGYSVKSAAGQASYYYSQPAYQVSGTLDLPNGPMPVTGWAWLDREWSSQPLSEDQTGWDWFSLTFDSGERLMAFRLRGETDLFTSGTWIAPDGQASPIGNGHVTATPTKWDEATGRQVPIAWDLQLPEKSIDIRIEALNPAAWMGTTFAYWEGPVQVSGSHQGKGYLEMTGYD